MLEDRYRTVARRLTAAVVVMALTFTIAGAAAINEFRERLDTQRAQQRSLAVLEHKTQRSAREAKMQTCIDLEEIRTAIRAVLRQAIENPDPGESTGERERLRRAFERFARVDCEKRVERIFGP